MIFIDTDIAIAVRDGDEATLRQVMALEQWPALSMVTRIELEAGVWRGEDPARRRALLDRMLQTFLVEPLGEDDILAYGEIVRTLGYDRQRAMARLIAAQAITRDAGLITRNGKDFRPIDGLKLEVWAPL